MERIRIGKYIVVTFCKLRGNRAVIGIDAPSDVKITREDAECRKGESDKEATT